MKVNVHLNLDEQTTRWSREVNARIRSIVPSIVNFSDSSSMIPHLTLAMGVISPDHTIDDVISLTRELVAKHPKPVNPCTLETLYLENVRGKYVFADIRPNSDFSTLKYHFEQAMLGTVLKSEDEYSATPHITLGHAESKQDEVQKLLTHIELPRQCGFSSVAVGEAGPKGTVISNIKTFKWQ